MKKKILGVIVCILLITTVVPAVTSLKNSTITTTSLNISQATMAENWTEMQKLFAIDSSVNASFGMSVSLYGDTAFVGTPYDNHNGNNSGSAYVYIRNGSTWTEKAKLLASDGKENNFFGISVCLYENTAFIGAYNPQNYNNGSTYVFKRFGTNWIQQIDKLPAGGPISIDHNTAIIGTRVFISDGTKWFQQQQLKSPGEDIYPSSVILSGETVLIGDARQDHNKGAVYVFTRTDTTWTQQAKLLASDGGIGDVFGISVSLEENTALIGAAMNIGNGEGSGAVYMFTRTSTTWTQQQKLTPSDGNTYGFFGASISLDGTTVLIGAPRDKDFAYWSGSVYVFTYSGTTWTQQQKLTATDGAAYDLFGCSVSLDGSFAVIGADMNIGNGNHSGSAYVFTNGGIPNLTFSFKGGLGVKVVITNEGTSDATGVSWQIHVQGGIRGRINKTVNGVVDIPAGKSKSVKTGILLGFGAISITVKVAEEEQTKTGKVILFFVVGVK